MLIQSTDNKVVTFAYPTSELFEQVQQLSSYVASNLNTPAAIDRYAITTDEHDLFDTLLRIAVGKLYEVYVGQTEGVEQSLFFDKEYDSKMCCGFSVSQPVCNENRLDLVDHANEQFVIESIMLEWAKINALNDQVALYQAAMVASMAAVAGHYFEVRKPSVGRCYTIKKQNDADIHQGE